MESRERMGKEVLFGMADGGLLGLEMGEECAKFRWEVKPGKGAEAAVN